MTMNASQHVAIVVVRPLTRVWIVFFIQHGTGGCQLFREGAHPAHLVLFDRSGRHRRGRLVDSDDELAMAMRLVVAIEVQTSVGGAQDSWEYQDPEDLMPWRELGMSEGRACRQMRNQAERQILMLCWQGLDAAGPFWRRGRVRGRSGSPKPSITCGQLPYNVLTTILLDSVSELLHPFNFLS